MSLRDWLTNPREEYRKLQIKSAERALRKSLESYAKEAQRIAKINEFKRVPIEGEARKIVDQAIFIAKSPIAKDDRSEEEKTPPCSSHIGDFRGWNSEFDNGDGLTGFSYFLKALSRSNSGVEPDGEPYGQVAINYLGKRVFDCVIGDDDHMYGGNHVHEFERGEWEDQLDALYQKAKKLTEK